jgi:leucyl aminopeptidase
LNCRIQKGRFEDYSGDALIAFVYQDKRRIAGPAGKLIDAAVKEGHFSAKAEEIFHIYPCSQLRAGRVILVGLGKKADASLETLRRAAAIGAKAASNARKIALIAPERSSQAIFPLVEGALLGNYRFDRLKSKKEQSKLSEISIFTGPGVKESAISQAQAMTEGTLIARDLANLPSNMLTPTSLANEAKKLGKQNEIDVQVLSESQIKKLKMGAMLSVGQGSVNRPRMVVWHYRGGRTNQQPLVFVGKGVTFDSGGISLKPSENMGAMKGDMSGAGAVIALIHVLGKLKPGVNVIGIAPLVENMPSGTAYRPGDVLTASNGKTIEVISTDAEGRLILADALVYASRFKPKYVVDIATLTGACMVALGLHICGGVMGRDQNLVKKLISAGESGGERLWQLPLWDDYGELLKSPVADIKNSGGRWGGAVTAAMFLSNFADGYPWAHIDMAGMDNEDKRHPYRSKGGTGWGVRVLSRFILDEAGKRSRR